MGRDLSTSPLLGTIILDLQAQSSSEAIEEISAELRDYLSGEDAERLTGAAIARESLMSTYLGSGIALPHARLTDTAPFCISFARSIAGIPWGDKGDTTHFIFLCIVPPFCANAYLELAKLLTKTMQDDQMRTELFSIADKVAAERWLRAHLSLI